MRAACYRCKYGDYDYQNPSKFGTCNHPNIDKIRRARDNCDLFVKKGVGEDD